MEICEPEKANKLFELSEKETGEVYGGHHAITIFMSSENLLRTIAVGPPKPPKRPVKK